MVNFHDSDLTMQEINKSLLNNKFLADIQFEIETRIIFVHSFELSKRSSVFMEQFKGNMGEMKYILIKGESYETFYQFLHYIYNDSCDITSKNTLQLLKLSRKYEIHNLENEILQYITSNKFVGLLLESLEFCINENYTLLEDFIKTTIALGFRDVIESNDFLSIDIKMLELLLGFDQISEDCSEIDIFNAVMRWSDHHHRIHNIDIKERRNVLQSIFKLIRFPVLSVTEFANCTKLYKNLLTDSEVLSIYKSITIDDHINEFDFRKEKRHRLVKQSLSFAKENVTKFSIDRDMTIEGFWIMAPQKTTIDIKLLDSDDRILKEVRRHAKGRFKYVEVVTTFNKPFLLTAGRNYRLVIVLDKTGNNIILDGMSKNRNPFIKFESKSGVMQEMYLKE